MSMSELTELRDRLELEFAAILAADLAANGASRVYVVRLTETKILAADASFRGLHGPSMADWFRDEIGGRWRGSGPAVLVNDHVIDDPEIFLGTCIHEMAHAVDTPGLYAT